MLLKNVWCRPGDLSSKERWIYYIRSFPIVGDGDKKINEMIDMINNNICSTLDESGLLLNAADKKEAYYFFLSKTNLQHQGKRRNHWNMILFLFIPSFFFLISLSSIACGRFVSDCGRICGKKSFALCPHTGLDDDIFQFVVFF